jgi:hypothetical protein
MVKNGNPERRPSVTGDAGFRLSIEWELFAQRREVGDELI